MVLQETMRDLISKIRIIGGKDFESDEASGVELLDFNGFDHACVCD